MSTPNLPAMAPQAPAMRAGIPTVDQLSKYSVNRQNQYEGIRQTLYDFLTYANAGQTQLSFFQVPVGQGGKTYADTNMQAAGTLPSPIKFLVQSIEIHFYPGVLNQPAEDVAAPFASPQFINDVAAVNKSGWLEFDVGSKNYLREAPLGVFPPKARLQGNAAIAGSIAGATASSFNQASFATFGGRPYMVDPWILLEPTQNFIVNLKWPAGVALPSGIDGRIGVKLDGIYYRLSQ